MSKKFKKVLVLSASAGAGHVMAANALVKAFNTLDATQEIFHLDTLQYTTKAFRNLYSKAYIEMANNAPEVLGWLYDAMDKPWKNEKRMHALERLNVGLFMRLLKRHQPDLVVNTHFLPADIISYLRKKEKLNCKQAVVVTDFDIHSMWLNRSVEQYFVACQEANVYLHKLGIPKETITTTGIPVDAVFTEQKSKQEMRRKYGLNPERTTILISAGGFGVGKMEHILKSLSEMEHPAQVLAMCGRNEELLQKIESMNKEQTQTNVQFHAVGFTTHMDEYMSASEIMIGKPGGLTTSEALTKGLAMVIVNPIPGQEERNSDYLLENGIAVKCNNLPTLAYKLDTLLGNPQRLQAMRNAAIQHGHPNAATHIVQTLLDTML